ncbi:MAG: DUF1549 domain-containing protein [Planctomycetota bacterium]
MNLRSASPRPFRVQRMNLSQRGASFRTCVSILLAVVGFISPARSDESAVAASQFSAEDLAFFERHVRPLLVEHCFECHSADRQKGQLRVDSRNALLAGGESGPAIEPGKANDSILIQAVRHESFQMPPKGRLSDESIAILEQWISRGAAWPGADRHPVRPHASGPEFTDEDRSWWALQAVKNPVPPVIEGDSWSRSEIDRFLLQQMQSHGLTPAVEADRATLIRRLTFDLTGLPPTPTEVAEFVSDDRPDAYEQLVDRLLSRPEYGERWARYWLDLVRYADSDGYRIDHYRPDAWRYRDYVIQSFNEDKPYDRFVQEQLAGDELFPDDPAARIATGFLRHWIYEYNNRDVRGQWDVILNEVTDTTSDVFLGVGLQCAKCHDHKYDPLLQKDYFRLRACFEAMRPEDRFVLASSAEQQAHAEQLKIWEEATADIRARIADLESSYRARAKQDAIEKYPPDIQQILLSDDAQKSPLEQQLFELAWRQVDYEYEGLDNRIKGDDKEKLLSLRKELASHDALKPEPLPTALTVTDIGRVAPETVIPRRRTVVGPGVPSLLDSAAAVIEPTNSTSATTGRRASLAKWMTQPGNPLTTRVIVNRIWQGHFGRGLAANASDFGTLGGPPSHPELLDWLTTRFLSDGWRLKPLHRLIVTSAAYRMSSEHLRLADFQSVDPTNRQYWRFNVRRLDAEQIRDAILAVSGQLDMTSGGPGVQSDVPRRSIYLRYMRNERDPVLDVFDLPLFFSSTSSRDTTTSPVQSLLLLNSQVMMNHSLKFANSLTKDRGSVVTEASSDADTIARLWQIAYCRKPTEDELTESLQFLASQRFRIEMDRGEMANASVPIGRLPYRDGQAILVRAEEKPIRMSRESTDVLNPAEFTLEACIQLRSVFDTGAVRTIASKWSGDGKMPGWTFGVTGKGSRRKPQTLVLQMFGRHADGQIREAAIFSDQHIELNTPYFVAVSLKPGTSKEDRGTVTFQAKNLANDDELLSTVTVEHDVIEPVSNDVALSLGHRSGATDSAFDGLIDDVRFSSAVLSTDQLLISGESAGPSTVAFWRFEPAPGLLEDSVTGLTLSLDRSEQKIVAPQQAALGDLCHILLNSSEFLYVK